MKKFLVCVANRMTPKMRHALKMVVKENEVDMIRNYCRENGKVIDIIPVDKRNVNRIAVVLNVVKSIKY